MKNKKLRSKKETETDRQMKRKSINDELASIADVGANNWVCQSNIDSEMLTKLYESPEFVRYAVYSGDLILEHMIEQDDYSNLQDPLGKLMSTAMTTFFSMPSARSISLALQTFFHSEKRSSTKSNSKYQLSNHPRPR